jgi:hypothetical protein
MQDLEEHGTTGKAALLLKMKRVNFSKNVVVTSIPTPRYPMAW